MRKQFRIAYAISRARKTGSAGVPARRPSREEARQYAHAGMVFQCSIEGGAWYGGTIFYTGRRAKELELRPNCNGNFFFEGEEK